MRVLHLVEPWNGVDHDQTMTRGGCDTLLAACALSCRDDAHTHAVCLLGPSIVSHRAWLAGLRPDWRIAPPLTRPDLARRSVKRLIRTVGPFDLVVCWGERVGGLYNDILDAGPAATIARLAIDAHDPSPASLLHAQGAMMPRWPSPWPALSEAQAAQARARLRAALSIADDDIVIAMLDDPANGANARRFIFLLGTLDVAGCNVVGLMQTGSREQPRARRFHHRVCSHMRVVVLDRPVQAMLHACDIAVLAGNPDREPHADDDATGVDAFNLTLAVNAGLPVVTAASSTLLPFIPEPTRSCLAASSHTTDMGRSLYPLVVDPQYRASIREGLRAISMNLPGAPLLAKSARPTATLSAAT